MAIPFRITTDRGLLSFFTTTTMFGSPVDITLSELAVECFYPADASTAQIVRETAAAQNVSPAGRPSTIQSIAS